MIDKYVLVPDCSEISGREGFEEHSTAAVQWPARFVKQEWLENSIVYVLETGCGGKWYPVDVTDNINDAVAKREHLRDNVCPQVRVMMYYTCDGAELL